MPNLEIFIIDKLILFFLLKELIIKNEKRRKNLMTSAIILLNIPIAAIYFHFLMVEFEKAFANL